MVALVNGCGQKGPLVMYEKKYPIPNADILTDSEKNNAR